MQVHGIEVKSNVASCPSCDKKFPTKNHLDRHYSRWLSKQIFQCTQCSLGFESSDRLHLHSLAFHQTKGSMNGDETTKNELQIGIDCAYCKFTAASRDTLYTHVHQNHLFTDQKINPNDHVRCSKCNKTFANDKGLKNHSLEFHLNLKKYSCKLCPKIFSRMLALKNHTKKNHFLKMPSNTQVGNLTQNVAKSEGNVVEPSAYIKLKPLLCNHCKKMFPEKTLLDKHLSKYSVETILQCQHCLIGFLDAEELDHHRHLHHSPLNARQYKPPLRKIKCQICEFSALSRIVLNTHIHQNHKLETNQIETISGYQVSNNFIGKAKLDRNSKSVQLKTIVNVNQQEEQEQEHGCPFCNASFPEWNLMIEHIGLEHKKKSNVTITPRSTEDQFMNDLFLKPHQYSANLDVSETVGLEKEGQSKTLSIGQNMSLAEEIKQSKQKEGSKNHLAPSSDKINTSNAQENVYQKTTYTCTQCPKRFFTPSHLQNHVKKSHTKDLSISDNDENVNIGKQKFICKYCPRKFITQHMLKVHVSDDHNYDIAKGSIIKPTKKLIKSKSGKSNVSEKLAKKLLNSKDLDEQESDLRHGHQKCPSSGFTCPNCNLKFPTAFDLHHHQLKWSKMMIFECEDCVLGFETQKKLNTHSKEFHSTQSSALLEADDPMDNYQIGIQCSCCIFTASTRQILKIHLHQSHKFSEIWQDPEDELSCSICLKTFSKSIDVDLHIDEEHLGIKGPL